MTTYRYGAVAWVWRTLILLAIAAGGALAVLAVTRGAPVLLAVAAPLLLPALFLGLVVAVGIEPVHDGDMQVQSLLFTRRTISRAQLGRTTVRQQAQATVDTVYAPRAWVRIRGGLPVYLDLLAHIENRRAFAAWWGIPLRDMPPGTG